MSGVDKQAAVTARAELHETLEQLAVNMNYAKRIDDAFARGKAKFIAQCKKRPAVMIPTTVVTTGAILAGIGFGAVALVKRLSRD